MLGLIRRHRRDDALDPAREDGNHARERGNEAGALERRDDPNPAVALAVGLIYIFRTAAGARMMRELEGAVRKYAADPGALWRLVREGDRGSGDTRGEVIDTTVATPHELPGAGTPREKK